MAARKAFDVAEQRGKRGAVAVRMGIIRKATQCVSAPFLVSRTRASAISFEWSSTPASVHVAGHQLRVNLVNANKLGPPVRPLQNALDHRPALPKLVRGNDEGTPTCGVGACSDGWS